MKNATMKLLGAATALALVAGSSTAQTTATASGDWVGGTWSNGEPTGTVDVTIASGVEISAVNSVTPWTGTLTLESDALLGVVSTSNPNAADLAIDGVTTLTLADGARVSDRFKTKTIDFDIDVTGTAGFDATGSNNGWNQNRVFTGTISGDTWTTKGYNHMGYTYDVAQDFDAYVIESGDRHGVGFNATGAAGNGDVTVIGRDTDGRSAMLLMGADNVFDSSAVLTFDNAKGWANSGGGFGPYAGGSHVNTEIVLRLETFSQTVSQLFYDGVEIASGTYTGADFPWLDGAGSLIVGGSPALPGDTDGDGDIDDSDLGTSFSNYTGPVGAAGGKTAAQGDTDGDGDVDDSDLGTSFSGYTGPLGPASVPEPTSLALLGLGGLLVARRRR